MKGQLLQLCENYVRSIFEYFIYSIFINLNSIFQTILINMPFCSTIKLEVLLCRNITVLATNCVGKFLFCFFIICYSYLTVFVMLQNSFPFSPNMQPYIRKSHYMSKVKFIKRYIIMHIYVDTLHLHNYVSNPVPL